ncbi:hypothetical protein FOMPIDRAFT_1042571 [Fomitopsis schrenkii]|uniref:Uncharacterized protein n=1 Tax=Fomitopsis schrenkii TaxID=2126942 RepID=S8E4H8_FOMSC|nr:hypothetical protein FOMPIDRAFT_1042571 [Fomitopsis schrenkii]
MDQLIRARYSNLGFGLTIRDDFTRIMLVYYGGASMPVFSSQEDIDAWVANRRQELEDSEADKSVRCYMSMSPTDIKGDLVVHVKHVEGTRYFYRLWQYSRRDEWYLDFLEEINGEKKPINCPNNYGIWVKKKWSLGNGLKCAIFEVEREEKYDSAKRDKGDMLEEDADQKEEQENTEDEDENEDEYTSAFSGEFKQRAVFRVPPSP